MGLLIFTNNLISISAKEYFPSENRSIGKGLPSISHTLTAAARAVIADGKVHILVPGAFTAGISVVSLYSIAELARYPSLSAKATCSH